MANKKISQLTSKSANLAATDLVEISEVSGSGYVSKRVSGQEIIDGVLANASNGTVTSVTGGTGLNGGTITTSGTLSVKYGTTSGTAAEGNDSRLSDSRPPSGTAGGDLSGTYPNPTVDGLQGQPVSNATPVNGQVLQYDGTTWVPGSIPSGGSGGGGVVYYLNFNTAADAPLANIPQTPNTSKELGITAETTATSYTSGILSTANYDFLASFVTDLNTPFSTSIPAGLWDFNIYAKSTTSNAANQTSFKIEVFKYDGSNAPVSLAVSNEIFIYDPTEITQYVVSVILPQTTILNTDRIVVYLYGKAHQNNNTLTFHFGDGYPSHVHSTIPSVTGTGVVKVLNGVFQSPASTIVNSDVSATANIEVSKLSMSSNRILGRTAAGSGSVEEISLGVTGNSGSATLSGNTLNIPTYTLSGLGGQPQLNGTGFVKATGTTITYDNSTYLTSAITSLNGLTASTQTFATPGTTGTAPNWNSATSAHTLNIPSANASGVTAGLISNTEFNTFNNKVSTGAITGSGLTMATSRLLGRTSAGTAGVEEITAGTGLTLSGGTLSVSGSVIQVGTSAVTSGTDGRVFFQAGGVIQQDAGFLWDTTNKRMQLLGTGVIASPALNSVLEIKAKNGLSDIAFRVRNSNDTEDLISFRGDGSQWIQSVPFIHAGTFTGTTNATQSLHIGYNAAAINSASSNSITIGRGNGALLAGNNNISIGNANAIGGFNSMLGIGLGVQMNAANTAFIGSETYPYSTMWVSTGGEVSSGANLRGLDFRVSGCVGGLTNQSASGVQLRFFSPNGTGSGAGSNIQFHVAPSNTGGSAFNRNIFSEMFTIRGEADGLNHYQLAIPRVPSASITDGYIQYSNDITAGNAAPHFRTENGSVIKLYQNAAVTTTQGVADALTNLGVLASSTIVPTVQSVASAATVTPTFSNDLVKITAQAVALTLAAPTGTVIDGKDLMIRIKDNGSAQTISWNAIYRAIGVTLPTTTVAGKTTYVGLIYNSNDTTWDVIGVTTQA